MIGNRIGHRLDPYINSLLNKTLGNRGNPNLFTLLGFLATLVASCLIVEEAWFLAGLAIILSGLFDLFDGVVRQPAVVRIGTGEHHKDKGLSFQVEVTTDDSRTVAHDDRHFLHVRKVQSHLCLLDKLFDHGHHRRDGVRIVLRWCGRDGDRQTLVTRDDGRDKRSGLVQPLEDRFKFGAF